MSENGNLLSGMRVIDCGTYIAGPAAATILSDFGAEVIKIERPQGGDPYRYLSFLPGMAASEHNYCWLLDARNKKSLALDLRDEAGREVLRKLISTADIFITNYPPDLAARFQVRYEDIEALNPRLIYAQITGYGEAGDDTNKPGYDTTAYWARSGLTEIMFDLTRSTGATPCGTGDHPVALALFGAIMLALYRRQMTGRGSKVSTSLMATGAWSNSCQIQAAMLGAVFPPKRTRVTALNPLVNGYQARDGYRFMLCCLDTRYDWGRLCRAIGRTDLTEDARYASADARYENGGDVVALLDEAFTSKDMAEWQVLFDQHSVIWGPIPKIDRVATDEQMKANGVFAEFDHPELGSVPTVNNPINVKGITKEKPKLAPDIGQHSIEIMKTLGYEDDAIQGLIKSGVIASAQ
ncbi:MAG TPA: CoA transferase [Blastocatellia bacterium]|nr:CoA transferase [Blastocatellia bacterium]